MLLTAKPADTGEDTHYRFYLARFRYDGTLDSYSQLALPFQPGQLAQLGDDSYIVIGTDLTNARPGIAVVDDSGGLLRTLDRDDLVPSASTMSQMMGAENFVGLDPNKMPPAQKTSYLMSVFRFVHDGEKVLLLEPGLGARVVEFSPDAEVRTVAVHLPKGQVAESLVAAPGKWLIRAHREDADDQQSLFQVDPATGEAGVEIATGAVPPTTVSCATQDGFFGLRWIEHKPYVISASY